MDVRKPRAGYRNIGHVALDCVPTCPAGCGHGTCTSPGTCTCQPGYTGAGCDQVCGDQRWGDGCGGQCHCDHGELCHHVTGQCYCPPHSRCSEQQTTTFPPSTFTTIQSSTTPPLLLGDEDPLKQQILAPEELQLQKKAGANHIEHYLMFAVGSIFAILLCTSLILTAIYFRFPHF